MAAEEYERLLFYDPENIAFLKQILSCYTKLGRNDNLESRLNLLDTKDKSVALSYYDLLIQTGKGKELVSLYDKQKNLFTEVERKELEFKIAVSRSDWKSSRAIYELGGLESYETIVSKIENTKFKSPAQAAFLSAIVPGLGRIYAKDAKDGIISLVFVGTFGYQAYRRFNQKGIKSVGGWIYGGVALGFYISNIYGSYQSAKYYNKKRNEEIHSFSLPLLLSDSQ